MISSKLRGLKARIKLYFAGANASWFILLLPHLIACTGSLSNKSTNHPNPSETVQVFSYQGKIELLQEGKQTSLRGLSVVDDSVAWVSGSNGWIARTQDCGQNWLWSQIPGYETLDFRDIEAFSSTEAVILSAGSPLCILRTHDGGHTWALMHRDDRPEIFFDGMDIDSSAQRLIAFGDPINRLMPLLYSHDQGQSWTELSEQSQLKLKEGEAGFAASGTSVRVVQNIVFIGTGGVHARLHVSEDFGRSWKSFNTPMRQGAPSQGIFSLAFADSLRGVIVGGDYQDDKQTEAAVWFTADGGQSWKEPNTCTGGYRSAVEYLGVQTYVAAGTSGVDWSQDGGENWEMLTSQGFHVVRQAKLGTWTLLAGADGRIAQLR